MTSLSASQVLPPPAVAGLAGHPHVVPDFGVAEIPDTKFPGEFPPIPLSSPVNAIPDAATALVGKSTAITEISPKPPIPPVPALVGKSIVTKVSSEPLMPQFLVPLSPVNAIPDAATAVVAKSTVITKLSPEPPLTSLSEQGLDQVLPPPAVASFAGHSPVVPATSVQGIAPITALPLAGISITTISGEEFPPILPSSPVNAIPDTTALVGKSAVITEISPEPPIPPEQAALVGKSAVITEISPEPPIPPVPAPSSPVNAIPDATTALVQKSTVVTEISPEPPIPQVPTPSSPVNAFPDTNTASTVITEISPEPPILPVPAPSSTVITEIAPEPPTLPVPAPLRPGITMKELIQTAILDPALIKSGNMLFQALADGDVKRACYTGFMFAILLFVRKYVI